MIKVNLPKDYLTQAYLVQKRSTKEIAEENNCAQSTVIRWLTVYGIPRHGFPVEDLTGKQFGRWQVVERANNDTAGRVRWKVKCTCGNIYTVQAYTLKKKASTKCKKCRVMEKSSNHLWTGYGEISGTFWSRLKYYSKRRKKLPPVQIDIKYGWKLFLRQNGKCALSGLPLQFGSYDLNEETTASLDRIDSSRGYVKGNVQWVHKTINKMKQDLPQDMFVEFCNIISEHNK